MEEPENNIINADEEEEEKVAEEEVLEPEPKPKEDVFLPPLNKMYVAVG